MSDRYSYLPRLDEEPYELDEETYQNLVFDDGDDEEEPITLDGMLSDYVRDVFLDHPELAYVPGVKDIKEFIVNGNDNNIVKSLMDMIIFLEKSDKEIIHDDLMEYSIARGLFDLAIFLKEHYFPCRINLYLYADGDLEKYKFIYEVLGVQSEAAIGYALSRGYIDCFEYLLSKGVPVTKENVTRVLYSNNLEAIKYIQEKNYGWNEELDMEDLMPYIGERTWGYCHSNNIPKKCECDQTCINCIEDRIEAIFLLWKMEEINYDNYIQWLPNELNEELIELIATI